MSDVINGVPRELLERAANLLEQYSLGSSATADLIRALLAAQPQASAAQSAPAGEREAVAAQDQAEVQRLRGQDGQDDQGNIVLTPQAVDVLAQCVAAHAYVLGALVNGRPDLALIEAKKWVDGFRDAASTGQEVK